MTRKYTSSLQNEKNNKAKQADKKTKYLHKVYTHMKSDVVIRTPEVQTRTNTVSIQNQNDDISNFSTSNDKVCL